MDVIAYTKISKLHAKKGITYPMLRFPKELDYIIGKNAVIYMVDSTHFLVEIQEKNPFEGFKTGTEKKDGKIYVRKTNAEQGRGYRARSKVRDLGSRPVGVRGFKSLPLHSF